MLISGQKYIDVPEEAFISRKLTEKLKEQVEVPLAMACDACPEWCERLTTRYSMLFPLDARRLFVSNTAFGSNR